jgi:hypothetical protein
MDKYAQPWQWGHILFGLLLYIGLKPIELQEGLKKLNYLLSLGAPFVRIIRKPIKWKSFLEEAPYL